MNIWVGNIAPEASDEELRELVKKYSGLEVTSLNRVTGDGTRPAAVVSVPATDADAYRIVQRLNGLFWKGRSLTVQAVSSRDST